MTITKDWKELHWTTKIVEHVTQEARNKGAKKMMISGVAISASTSRNGITYEGEELGKAAASLKGRPLMKDHSGSVRDIVGRVKTSVWNSMTQSIEFSASVLDEEIQEMLRDGRITDVSIGAKVDDLRENEDGTVSAIGIEFLELSLVAVPGIVDQGITGIDEAVKKSLLLKEKLMGKTVFPTKTLDVKALETLKQSVNELTATMTENSEIKLIEVRL